MKDYEERETLKPLHFFPTEEQLRKEEGELFKEKPLDLEELPRDREELVYSYATRNLVRAFYKFMNEPTITMAERQKELVRRHVKEELLGTKEGLLSLVKDNAFGKELYDLIEEYARTEAETFVDSKRMRLREELFEGLEGPKEERNAIIDARELAYLNGGEIWYNEEGGIC